MAPSGNQTQAGRVAPRLYLVTPPIADPAGFADVLAAMLATADVAAVLLHLDAADERTLVKRVKALAPLVQDKGAALLLDEHAEIAVRAGADGAHLHGIDAFKGALTALKPARIAGCGALATRHDAMLAAEAGADYVLFGEFGEPAAVGRRPPFAFVRERVAWWAELFEVPCVGCAETLAEVDELAAAGADFIAVGNCVFADARGSTAAIADAARRLQLPEAVG